MKAILISIKPKYVADILNGLKTIEVRKRFPSDYVGWVYIYCTKNGTDCYGMPTDLVDYRGCAIYNKFKLMPKGEKVTTDDNQPRLNGKVVARFWCDKVEDYVNGHKWSWKSGAPMFGACNDYEYILKDTCLTEDELYDYCEDLSFKAIRITKVDPFDKPKELKEFLVHSHTVSGIGFRGEAKKFEVLKPLARAPQSWCYIEV